MYLFIQKRLKLKSFRLVQVNLLATYVCMYYKFITTRVGKFVLGKVPVLEKSVKSLKLLKCPENHSTGGGDVYIGGRLAPFVAKPNCITCMYSSVLRIYFASYLPITATVQKIIRGKTSL